MVCIHLCLIGGGGGVCLPWPSTTCETALVYGSAMGICALCTMQDLWGVMVLHGSLVNWQGRCNGIALIYGQLAGGRCNSVAWIYGQLAGGSICHGYMCNGFAYIYAWLEEGWGMSAMAFYYMWNCLGVWVCHEYMCIVYYVRLMGCNGVAWIYGQLAGRRCKSVALIYGQSAGGQSVMGICAFCNMWNFLDATV